MVEDKVKILDSYENRDYSLREYKYDRCGTEGLKDTFLLFLLST